MIGGQLGPQVWDLVQQWTPSQVYGHENDYQSELRDFLDENLNSGGRGPFAASEDYPVSKERGTSYGDVVVDDTVGIELKRNFSNSQKRKLRGQLEDYGDNYEFVIACACGIEDTDGWHEVKSKFKRGRGGMMERTEYRFIIKERDDFGSGGGDSQNGPFGGNQLF